MGAVHTYSQAFLSSVVIAVTGAKQMFSVLQFLALEAAVASLQSKHHFGTIFRTTKELRLCAVYRIGVCKDK